MSEGAVIEETTYIRAVNLAIEAELGARPDVVVFGEDVALPNGPFGATKGLHKRFGSDRVFDTPISESAMIGAALGAAMGGLRPIVEVMYGDFLFVSMDQIVNQVANTRYISRGRLTAPLVIRTQQGSTPGACAQHSHSVEAWLAHIPGLRVALPSTSQDAYSILRAAVAADDPVVIIESRALYPTKGTVDLDLLTAAVSGASVVAEGDDVTILGWGAVMPKVLAAAAQLGDAGIAAEVVDLRWAAPLDVDTVAASVAKTRKVVIVHEDVRTGGLGAEITAQLYEALAANAIRHRRVATADVPIPAAPTLSSAVLPSADQVAAAAMDLINDKNGR